MAEQYNGWRNWDTWNVYNWLTSDDVGTYRGAQATDNLKVFFAERFGASDTGLSIDGIDLNEVDWQELKEALRE